MYREITNIRVTKSINATTENIYRVKLENSEEQHISVVKARMAAGVTYFFVDAQQGVVEIELTYPIYKQPYLRSTNYDGVHDYLLDLPHF